MKLGVIKIERAGWPGCPVDDDGLGRPGTGGLSRRRRRLVRGIAIPPAIGGDVIRGRVRPPGVRFPRAKVVGCHRGGLRPKEM